MADAFCKFVVKKYKGLLEEDVDLFEQIEEPEDDLDPTGGGFHAEADQVDDSDLSEDEDLLDESYSYWQSGLDLPEESEEDSEEEEEDDVFEDDDVPSKPGAARHDARRRMARVKKGPKRGRKPPFTRKGKEVVVLDKATTGHGANDILWLANADPWDERDLKDLSRKKQQTRIKRALQLLGAPVVTITQSVVSPNKRAPAPVFTGHEVAEGIFSPNDLHFPGTFSYQKELNRVAKLEYFWEWADDFEDLLKPYNKEEWKQKVFWNYWPEKASPHFGLAEGLEEYIQQFNKQRQAA